MADYSKMPGLKNPGMKQWRQQKAAAKASSEQTHSSPSSMHEAFAKSFKAKAKEHEAAATAAKAGGDQDRAKEYEEAAKAAHTRAAHHSKKAEELQGQKFKGPLVKSGPRDEATKSVQTGPKGGRYYTSSSGEKVYVK